MSTTVPVGKIPMPPVIGVSAANRQARRWIPFIMALKPMVQRQKRAARSGAVPAVGDPLQLPVAAKPRDRETARIVAPCIANKSAEP